MADQLSVSPVTSQTNHALPSEATTNPTSSKSFAFWMTFLSLCLSLSLFALELTSVSTALPTIVEALHVSEFVWVGASYALASMACIPIAGNTAQVFGRKPTLVAAVLIFAVGSALCGGAHNSATLLVGRTIQGFGGGSIVALGDILLGDLVPLKERGTYFGLLGLTWSIACSIGPVVGGALASGGPYRGSILCMGASTAIAIALAWGGVQFSWGSVRVLLPLIVGVVGLAIFIIFEKKWAKEPIICINTLLYLQSVISAVVALAGTYFIPVYYQACKGASPILSGVETLGFAVIAPAAIVGGILVNVSQKYRPWLWVGWCLMIIGSALMTTVKATTPTGHVVGLTAIVGFGIGWIYAVVQFPIQAPLPVNINAQSMALLAFTRAFGSIWGVSIGNTVLQNILQHQLPEQFTSEFTGGIPIVYALIPTISSLPPPVRELVREAFADGLKLLWQILTGISALGLLCSLPMLELPMIGVVDENWAMKQGEEGKETGTPDSPPASKSEI
ncbi:hypothetical protein Clacol_004969 [Clathrus columnatus]|uniref:Major facilitator superfamily (MFS) profile domain-containing protein n=1 Tax=Clathrus columnatus TaxID=1419009 RepID=A0AAV5A7Y4_9AGAM|nr:hypothetical protein Clacol_004969 [Clathrus columnatus]